MHDRLSPTLDQLTDAPKAEIPSRSCDALGGYVKGKSSARGVECHREVGAAACRCLDKPRTVSYHQV
jgi:hypothetical protein